MDRETLEKLIKGCGVSLYDTEIVTENGRKIYRIYITSKDGITLDKCEEVTKIVSPILDTNPPIEGSYFLEVSSPGVERQLKKMNHFKSSVGELVKVETESGKDKGKLIKVDENEEKIYLRDKKGEVKEISYSDIKKAKTYFQWK